MLEANKLEVRLKLDKELVEFCDHCSDGNGVTPVSFLKDCPGKNRVVHSRRLERVVRAMSSQFDPPMTNEHLANIACLSPYHFNRVFRNVVGIPPIQFHYALRLERAKRLLINSELSITDICFEIGYNSLGTFVSRFKELVGLPPSAFRCLGRHLCRARLVDVRATCDAQPHVTANRIQFTIVNAARDFDGLVFTALFPRAIAEGIPGAFAITTGSESSYLQKPGDGEWHVFSVAIPWQCTGAQLLTLDGFARGHSGVIRVTGTRWFGANTVTLAPPGLLDPPFLVMLPMLVSRIEMMDPPSQAGRTWKAAATLVPYGRRPAGCCRRSAA
jgi:AraC family transcriptional regulator